MACPLLISGRVDMAHVTQNVGGGHFALCGAYLDETDEIVVVDTNPSVWRVGCVYL